MTLAVRCRARPAIPTDVGVELEVRTEQDGLVLGRDPPRNVVLVDAGEQRVPLRDDLLVGVER